ncbi:hypothetical protein FB45DRAFT_111617 [Roridomyces roridus]|uniref:Uncharacterized protein n=1 Tax=Roridomyces roridus TaxID=1738132 RepID=A0AAD7BKV8_9AGAR|nr:hypothetical protein FB45DRAFT_111617 [Roridomyces roridus]
MRITITALLTIVSLSSAVLAQGSEDARSSHKASITRKLKDSIPYSSRGQHKHHHPSRPPPRCPPCEPPRCVRGRECIARRIICFEEESGDAIDIECPLLPPTRRGEDLD